MKLIRILFFIIAILLIEKVIAQDTIKTNDINRIFESSLFPGGIKNINVYSRQGCGRCGSVTEQLNSANISFVEFDYAIDSIQRILDYKIYNSLPYKNLGYSTRFPVIEIDSILFFSIENHDDFVKSLKEFIKGKDD